MTHNLLLTLNTSSASYNALVRNPKKEALTKLSELCNTSDDITEIKNFIRSNFTLMEFEANKFVCAKV